MDSAGTRTGARPAVALSGVLGVLFLLFTLLLWPLHYLTGGSLLTPVLERLNTPTKNSCCRE